MKRKTAETWLSKAQDDLLWTNANIKERIYYGACFTAQQAAEKALKAYLLSRSKNLRKIHDLSALLEECILLDKDFRELRETVLPLIDYYVQARYPDIGEFIEYSEEKAKDAFERATSVVDFVNKKLIVSH